MEGGNVGALEEFSDGDFVTPQQRFLHRAGPVSRVVNGVLLELLHARTEPLVGIVVIISDARAEDVQEGEALVQDTLLDQLRQVLLFTAETAGDEGGACGQRQGNGIDRCFDVAEGHAFRLHADAAGR